MHGFISYLPKATKLAKNWALRGVAGPVAIDISSPERFYENAPCTPKNMDFNFVF